MSDTDDDIRAVAESIAVDAQRLKQLEDEKAAARSGDPKLRSLADEARDVVTDLAVKVQEQTTLVDEATAGR